MKRGRFIVFFVATPHHWGKRLNILMPVNIKHICPFFHHEGAMSNEDWTYRLTHQYATHERYYTMLRKHLTQRRYRMFKRNRPNWGWLKGY